MILLFVSLYKTYEDKLQTWIESAILWMLYCFCVTEILSVFLAISRGSLFAAWGVLDVLLIICLFARRNREAKIVESCTERHSVKSWLFDKLGGQNNRLKVLWLLFACGMIFLVLRIVPYNWDSQTYHLARIYHWAQNGSVAHYATHVMRQVGSPVLAAFVKLHVYVLTGSGKSVLNLVQCISYLSCGLLVYGLAKKLAVSRSGCILAAVLFYAMPIAFAEATTTQDHEFATFWCLAFVYLLLDLLQSDEKIAFDRQTLKKVIYLAMCVAFGYMSKPTVMFAMAMGIAWLCIVMLKRRDSFRVLGYAGIAAAVILALLLPEWMRNLHTFGGIMPSSTAGEVIGSLHPKHLLMNFLKNLSFNTSAVWLYHSADYVQSFLQYLAGLLKIDINSPAIAFGGQEFTIYTAPNYGCDTAVNPTVFWLIIVCIVASIILAKELKKDQRQLGYCIAMVLSFCLLCTITVWSKYVSRFQLTYFALLCPAVAVVIDLMKRKLPEKVHAGIVGAIYFLCITECLGLGIYYSSMTSDGSDYGFFAIRGNIYADYAEMADAIRTSDCDFVGLLIGGDSYEYPLTQMIDPDTRMEHVNVSGELAAYEDIAFIPDFVIQYDTEQIDELVVHGTRYEKILDYDSGALWRRVRKN